MEAASVIRYEYSLESLNGISPTAFEAELHDALRERFGKVGINIVQGINDRCWGEYGDGREIPAEEIRRVGEEVFTMLCRRGGE